MVTGGLLNGCCAAALVMRKVSIQTTPANDTYQKERHDRRHSNQTCGYRYIKARRAVLFGYLPQAKAKTTGMGGS